MGKSQRKHQRLKNLKFSVHCHGGLQPNFHIKQETLSVAGTDWQYSILDQQNTPCERVKINQYSLMGANSELTAVAALPLSFQKKGENLKSFSEGWLCKLLLNGWCAQGNAVKFQLNCGRVSLGSCFQIRDYCRLWENTWEVSLSIYSNLIILHLIPFNWAALPAHLLVSELHDYSWICRFFIFLDLFKSKVFCYPTVHSFTVQKMLKVFLDWGTFHLKFQIAAQVWNEKFRLSQASLKWINPSVSDHKA